MAAVKVKIGDIWYILPNMKGDKGVSGRGWRYDDSPDHFWEYTDDDGATWTTTALSAAGTSGAPGESAVVKLKALPASGVTLVAGDVYYGSITGEYAFNLPAGNTLDLDYENIIRVYFYVTGTTFIDWGTYNFAQDTAPVIVEAVSYTAEFVYSRMSSTWELTVVGKGGVPT